MRACERCTGDAPSAAELRANYEWVCRDHLLAAVLYHLDAEGDRADGRVSTAIPVMLAREDA